MEDATQWPWDVAKLTAALMFGVGLHFHLKDLLAVRHVAIPGAIGQSAIATLLALAVAASFGWPIKSGLVLGMAMSVASTVVLMRVLMDNRMLDNVHGHVAVGWLLVEDILTVIVLVLIPTLGVAQGVTATAQDVGIGHVLLTLCIALVKLSVMMALILWGGKKIIPWIMIQVTRLRSRELFTLTVLMIALAALTRMSISAFEITTSAMAPVAALRLVGKNVASTRSNRLVHTSHFTVLPRCPQ